MDQLHRNGTANGTGIGLLDPDDLDAWYPEDEEEVRIFMGRKVGVLTK